MKKILWLDDVRNPNDSRWKHWLDLTLPSKTPKDVVIWVVSYEEFVVWVTHNGLPDVIAFDHDLGVGKTGYDAAKWVVEYCLDSGSRLPDWVVQSANPVGEKNINKLFKNFLKYN